MKNKYLYLALVSLLGLALTGCDQQLAKPTPTDHTNNATAAAITQTKHKPKLVICDEQHTQVYTVKHGDSVYNIAKSNHTSTACLVKLNPKLHYNPSEIKIGEKLNIPTAPTK